MKRFVTFEPIRGDVHRFDTLEEAISSLKNEINDVIFDECNTIPQELYDGGGFVAEVKLNSEVKTIDTREECEKQGKKWMYVNDSIAEVNLVSSIYEQPASIIDEVRNERLHQRGKGYDEEHDDTQVHYFFNKHPIERPLIGGAIVFCKAALGEYYLRKYWPWEKVGLQDFIPPDSPRDALIKAAAMLVAEVERMDRAATAKVEEAAG